MKYICSLITVSDIQKSKDFYTGMLNQEVEMDFGENVSFKGGFAIHLKSHFAGLIDSSENQIIQGAKWGELYFESDDISSVQDNLDKAGIQFVHRIKEHPWKQRAMRLYDPDMHIIEIGESMESTVIRLYKEGFTLSAISEMTLMPAAFVENAVKNNS